MPRKPPPTVKLQFIQFGRDAQQGLFITIDGRQAINEGPRRIGHCYRCKGRCRGVTWECDTRVYEEGRRRAS